MAWAHCFPPQAGQALWKLSSSFTEESCQAQGHRPPMVTFLPVVALLLFLHTWPVFPDHSGELPADRTGNGEKEAFKAQERAAGSDQLQPEPQGSGTGTARAQRPQTKLMAQGGGRLAVSQVNTRRLAAPPQEARGLGQLHSNSAQHTWGLALSLRPQVVGTKKSKGAT